MTARVEICLALPDHAERMAPMMRAADAAEVMASNGEDPRTALQTCLEWSQESYAGYIGGELACLFGVGPGSFLLNTGVPWMLSTAVVERHPRAFYVASRSVVSSWLERYDSLEQMVDVRHVQALRWLRHLGFTIEQPRLWGHERRPFCRVHIERAN